MIHSYDEALALVLNAWDDAGLDMPKRQRSLIRQSGARGNALSDSVVEKINSALKSYTPADALPACLDEIDGYYGEMLGRKQAAREIQELTGQPIGRVKVLPGKRSRIDNRYVDMVMLLSPLVYFDAIISLESFDDNFLSRMELAFLSRLDIPRNLHEAERIYARLLTLPDKFVTQTVFGKEVVKQPFMAQMMFAALLMGNHEKGSELWQFKKDCLENCPDYLLEIPDYPDPGSARPSVWLSMVGDPDLLDIMRQRGSARLKEDVTKALEHRARREATTATVASDAVPSEVPLVQRVAPEQAELAELLSAFDAYFGEQYPALFKKLQPGVLDDQIDKLNEALTPLRLSEDVATLYKWHNGLEMPSMMFGFPEPSTIESALHQYQQSIEILGEFSWTRVWFPLAYDARTYRLVLLAEERCGSTPVLLYDLEEGLLTVEHQSIQAMVQSYLEAYRSGFAAYDESTDAFEIDEQRFNAVRIQNSPQAYDYPSNQKAAYDIDEPAVWPDVWRKYKVRSDS